MPLNESELPDKVAYHPNVRCVRGGGGEGPVIVGRMYRVLGGEGYVCEEEATPEEKAKDPVEPAKNFRGDPVEGFDLRGWAAADIQALRDADGKLDLFGAILCGVDLVEADLNKASLRSAQLQGANLIRAQLQGADLSGADLSVSPRALSSPSVARRARRRRPRRTGPQTSREPTCPCSPRAASTVMVTVVSK